MLSSNLKFNISNSELQHKNTLNRNAPFQHILESIYRASDNKNLAEILDELYAKEHSFLWEYQIATEGQTEVTLTKFSFNPAKDELYVNVAGVDCLEGPDKQFVKISPTQIKFNFPLKEGYEIIIALMGTKSNASYGSEITTALQKFTQLVDTPDSYVGNQGKFLKVNDTGTGLVFANNVGPTLKKFEFIFNNVTNTTATITTISQGMIKGIKCIPDDNVEFEVSLFSKLNADWIYYSGKVETILWDIMDIPFVNDSDTMFVKILNFGSQTNFKLQIFIVI